MESSQSKPESPGKQIHGPSHEDHAVGTFPLPEYQVEVCERVNKIMDERRKERKALLSAHGGCIAAAAGLYDLDEDKPPPYEEATSGIHDPADEKPLLPLPDNCHNGRIKVCRRNSI